MPEKENQHFVSQFYLRGFTQPLGDRVLWQYSKADTINPMMKSPARAASESHFYSVQRDDGTWDHSLEDSLSAAETNAAPALRRFIESGHSVEADRLRISCFIGLTYLRVKALRDHANTEAAKLQDPKVVVQIVERDREDLVRRFGEKAVSEYVSQVAASGQGLAMKKNFQLVDLFRRSAEWGARINRLSWTICRVKPPCFFVTSDNPTFTRSSSQLFAPGVLGFERRDLGAELGFPLSSSAFLLARPVRKQAARTGGRVRSDCLSVWCEPSRARELNLRTVLSAYEYVFSPFQDKDVQALIERHKGFRLQYPIHPWT